VVFIGAFAFIIYGLVATYGRYMYKSVKGKGYLGAIVDQVHTHQYFMCAISLIAIVNSSLVLWEIFSFILTLLKEKRPQPAKRLDIFKDAFKKISLSYKSTFLAMLVGQLLPKIILVHMFWIWLPHLRVLQLFTVNLQWYSWIYGYLCWELASWIFHYSSHRVRLLWCFHSPHHGMPEINMTVNWIHFFAESYYSTFVRLVFLLMMGVNPMMFGIVMLFDSGWGIFIHVSDRALADGRLGFMHHLIITPAHHRVHHAKNHLYLDTNFANVLPVWDWVFGTLQPIRQEVRTEYGLLRDLDATNFSDLYLGELVLLYRDIKYAKGLRNKLLYLFMPPGWMPGTFDQTSLALRRNFVSASPELAVTSRDKLLAALQSGFRNEKFPEQEPDILVLEGK